jgi:predicted CXXCH cytochrome family protein
MEILCFKSLCLCVSVVSVFNMKTILLVLLLAASPVWAADSSAPKLDFGKGGQCVEDTQWMRKNHMHLLKHGRDDALRLGIRDEKRSLKTCIECHASTQDNSVIAREDSFCVGCHKYEAVKLDCFECHSGTRKSAWLAQRNAK